MRPLFSVLFLLAFLLTACVPGAQGTLPVISPTSISTTPTHTPAQTSPPATPFATREPPTPAPSHIPPTPTIQPTATSAFVLTQGVSIPLDRPLIAYEAGSTGKKVLFLADPNENAIYEFSFPAEAHYATPFVAGLSPDARYFVYFEGGQLEILYNEEHLRTNTPDLVMHVLDLRSGKVIFSTPLLNPSFPKDLARIGKTIKDEWWFANFDAPFEEVVSATQQELLDYIRNIAWSPDSSLLAFAAQKPGPSSDLYFFNPKSGTARRVTAEPWHILHTVWAPDSSALFTITSLYDRQAREDTTYMLARDGSILVSDTSQVWFFHNWFDSSTVFLYGGTDAGDYFELKIASATEKTISMLWDGTYSDIAFAPDLSTFLVSSNMPSEPIPPSPGLYRGSLKDGSLINLSKSKGWTVAYWGSERFAFAASSLDGGTVGITPDGEMMTIEGGVWDLTASPDGSYLAGYHDYYPGYLPGYLPGLRIFDNKGLLLESMDDANVTCVLWNAASTALAFQVESNLYLWEAASGSTRLISDELNKEECAFKWVQEIP